MLPPFTCKRWYVQIIETIRGDARRVRRPKQPPCMMDDSLPTRNVCGRWYVHILARHIRILLTFVERAHLNSDIATRVTIVTMSNFGPARRPIAVPED